MTNTEQIAALNDVARRTLGALGGSRTVLTCGIAALEDATQGRIIQAVRTFDTFTRDNNPHGERDFGTVTVDGFNCYWKIDYYDKAMQWGSNDPADPSQTTRVLTIMLTEEY